MRLQRLRIHNLRVIEDLDIHPERGLNLFSGPNGAGKTSLLEAVYIAGRARPFTGRDLRPLTRSGCDEAHVFVEIVSAGEMGTRLGVGWRAGRLQARRDGQPVQRRSDLMRILPTQVITARSHELIEKGPDVRRRFLDLGLFHVEPDYQTGLSEFSTVLRQRNAALRHGDGSARAFDTALIRCSARIDSARCNYVERLLPLVREMLESLGRTWDLEAHYRVGTTAGADLAEALAKHWERDRHVGHTTQGAHRSGLDLIVDGGAAERRLSRGQQKILVCALLMAQARLHRRETEDWPVLLVDDLPSELDKDSSERLLTYLADGDWQSLVTGTEWPADWTERVAMFHVEQGRSNRQVVD